MMRKRGLLLVVLSVLIAAGAAWMANNYVKNRLATAAAVNGPTVEVVAAAMHMPYGTKIESRHVKTITVPENVLPPGAVRDFAEIEGQVVKSDIMNGEIIVKDRVANTGGGSTLAALVAPNKRAVTVRVNDVIGVAGFLLPGNYVDVLGTRLEMGTSRRAVTDTIIHLVKVLAVDQTAATEKNEPVVVRAVTLELTPEEAEVLVKWEEEGTIQLALRNPDDTMVAESRPLEQPAQKPQARPARRPTAVAEEDSVTLIRGTKVQNAKAKG